MAKDKPKGPKPPKKPKPKGYHYVLHPDSMDCFSGGNTQTVLGRLWEAEGPTEAHDAQLMGVTEEVNRVLDEAAKQCPHRHWELTFIKFRERYMLAWTHPRRGLGPDDDPELVAKALRLKPRE